MVGHMKTTVGIPDSLLSDAKRLAVEEGLTLRELVVTGLRLVLKRRDRDEFRLRDARVDGRGVQVGVNEGDWTRIQRMIYTGRGG